MKLDAADLRYLSSDEWRVLRAFETLSAHYEVIPTSSLSSSVGSLNSSSLARLAGGLAKRNLVQRVKNSSYDGFRLTYGGADWLAVKALREKGLEGTGPRVGVGKESDIYSVSTSFEHHPDAILKVHRLGRISFRAVKEKRDYLGHRQNASWMYLSKLAAKKEWEFMNALYAHGFPVPQPLAHSRHAVLMARIPAYPLRQIASLPSSAIPLLFDQLMNLLVRLAKAGLVHGDFNEYNLLVLEKEQEKAKEEEEEERGDGKARHEKARKEGGKEEGHDDAASRSGPGGNGQVTQVIEKGNGFERIILRDAVSKSSAAGMDEQAAAGSSSASSASAYQDEATGASSDAQEEEQEDEEEDGEGDEDVDEDQSEIHLEDGTTLTAVLIDFPQMVSVEHLNAEYFFDRDVECVIRFFRKRFRYNVSREHCPKFSDYVSPDRALRRAGLQKREQEREREKGRESSARGEEDGREGASSQTRLHEKEEEEEDVMLDVITDASGLSGLVKGRQLEEYMSRLHLQSEAGLGEDEDGQEDEEAAGSSKDSKVNDDDSDAEEEDEEEKEEEITTYGQRTAVLEDRPPDMQGPDLHFSTRSRRPRRPRASPFSQHQRSSLGADANGEKAEEEEEEAAVSLRLRARVAEERERREKKEKKHHGGNKRAPATGRKMPGGKAKGVNAKIREADTF